MTWTYEHCRQALATARDRARGKPIDNHTRIFDRGSCLAIQHHSTDILRFYPDGSKEVCTGWTSNSTLARIREYGGIRVRNRKTPTINRRRPYPEKTMCIGKVVFAGINGYLRIQLNGEVDLATVRPIKLDVITDPNAVTAARHKAKQLADQVLIRCKLGVNPASGNAFNGNWLRSQLGVPLTEVDYTHAPQQVDLSGNALWFARLIGAHDTISLKEIA